jgi:hypothetical protein
MSFQPDRMPELYCVFRITDFVFASGIQWFMYYSRGFEYPFIIPRVDRLINDNISSRSTVG